MRYASDFDFLDQTRLHTLHQGLHLQQYVVRHVIKAALRVQLENTTLVSAPQWARRALKHHTHLNQVFRDNS